MSNNFSDKIGNIELKLKPTLLLKIAFIVLMIAIIVGVILFFLQTRTNNSKTKEEILPSVKIAPENLWIPEEPIELPPIQFSREQKKAWSDADIEKFFVEPENHTIENLHEKNSKKIKNLLEGIE